MHPLSQAETSISTPSGPSETLPRPLAIQLLLDPPKMTSAPDDLVLPRPGTADSLPTRPPISGPPESAFTTTFGQLLPPATFLPTPHGKIAYYAFPPSSSPATNKAPGPTRVLLLHGIQTPALGLLPLTRDLRSAFPASHFVLPDLYGHGLSDTPFASHTPELFYALIDAVLEALQWPAAHLVGYSFGGATAAGYSARRPERVRSLALVAPAGLYRGEQFAAEHLRGDDEGEARRYVLRLLEGGELVVPSDWRERVQRGEVVAEALREWQMREHVGHAASVVSMFRDGGVMDRHADFVKASQTGVPSLVVLAELDDVGTEQDLNYVGFANVAVIPQAGHAVVREKASDVSNLIKEFWIQHDGR